MATVGVKGLNAYDKAEIIGSSMTASRANTTLLNRLRRLHLYLRCCCCSFCRWRRQDVFNYSMTLS